MLFSSAPLDLSLTLFPLLLFCVPHSPFAWGSCCCRSQYYRKQYEEAKKKKKKSHDEKKVQEKKSKEKGFVEELIGKPKKEKKKRSKKLLSSSGLPQPDLGGSKLDKAPLGKIPSRRSDDGAGGGGSLAGLKPLGPPKALGRVSRDAHAPRPAGP